MTLKDNSVDRAWLAQVKSYATPSANWPSPPPSIANKSKADGTMPRRTKPRNKISLPNHQGQKSAGVGGRPSRHRPTHPRAARTLKLRRDQVPCLKVLDSFRLLPAERELLLDMFDDAQIARVPGFANSWMNQQTSCRGQITSNESFLPAPNEVLSVNQGFVPDEDQTDSSYQHCLQSSTPAATDTSSSDIDNDDTECCDQCDYTPSSLCGG